MLFAFASLSADKAIDSSFPLIVSRQVGHTGGTCMVGIFEAIACTKD